MDETTPADNAAFLHAALMQRLSAEVPERVLDVGCGRGELLARCRAAGLAALGLEAAPDRAAVVRAAGDAVVVAGAEQLPFADRAVPWVVMRHVAHHLSDPERGVRELARVARRGVIVAEPWRPLDRPEQRTAAAIDLWCKGHHRRQGREHHPDLRAVELLGWLRSTERFGGGDGGGVVEGEGRGRDDIGSDVACDVSEIIHPACLPRETVQAELQAAVADLPRDHTEVQRVGEWLALADETGVGATGTVIVVVSRVMSVE